MYKFHNIFLLVVCLRACVGYKVTSSTGQNKISSSSNSCISCKDTWTCDSDSNKSFPDKGCYCDKLCGVMNDCCTNFIPDDSKIADRFNKSMFECRRHPEDQDNYDYGVYFVEKCPAKWQDEEVRQLCEGDVFHSDFIENINEKSWIISDLDIPLYNLLSVTVIEHLTGVMYKNPFCAYCHGDIDNALEWQTKIYNEIEYSEEKKPYQMHELIDGKMHRLVNKHTYRLCWLPLDPAYCPPRANMKDKDACFHGEFAAFWDSSDNLYKNIHCAMCNHMSCDELQCESSVNISSISEIRPGGSLGDLIRYKSKKTEIIAQNKSTIGKPVTHAGNSQGNQNYNCLASSSSKFTGSISKILCIWSFTFYKLWQN